MTKPEFESWAREAEGLRDQALKKYKGAKDAEARKAIANDLDEKINQTYSKRQ